MTIIGSKAFEGVVGGSRQLWLESLSSVQRQSLRVFCFPYAGGNAQVFRKWQRYFPSDIDVCLVHLPGRGNRIGETPFTRLLLLVDALANLFAREAQQPFVLFGHSLGALISFELTRELRRRRLALPLGLILSGRGAPSVPGLESPTFNLPHDEFIAKIRGLNGTPKELLDDPETRDFFLPTLRADFEMVDTYEYHPEEKLSTPITVYGGIQDEEVRIESLRAWEELTSGSWRLRMFPGDHFFIHNAGTNFLELFRSDVLKHLT
jgi:surfactin synthase thioesterase subunit